jgi:hypothetical protein
MNKFAKSLFVVSALTALPWGQPVFAETISRFDCNIVGNNSREALGDTGHALITAQYSCRGIDGLFKDAVYSGSTISEDDGAGAKYLAGMSTYRFPGGLAVGKLTEGSMAYTMKDGKPIGWSGSGKAVLIIATGAASGLAGKTILWTTKGTGLNRYAFEIAGE